MKPSTFLDKGVSHINKIITFFILFISILHCSCNQKKREQQVGPKERYCKKLEKEAKDCLVKHNLNNYIDSAYLYTYIYFGGDIIRGCNTIHIDSVLSSIVDRKIIYQDLILIGARFSKDSSSVFLSLSPLIADSILSCYIVDGPQLPNEIMFNYKEKKFVQFVYDENSFMKVTMSPLEYYENNLKKVLEADKKEPHKKFKELWEKYNLNVVRGVPQDISNDR